MDVHSFPHLFFSWSKVLLRRPFWTTQSTRGAGKSWTPEISQSVTMPFTYAEWSALSFIHPFALSEHISSINCTILIFQNSVALPDWTTWWHHKITHGFRVQLAYGGVLKEPPAMGGRDRQAWAEFLVKLHLPSQEMEILGWKVCVCHLDIKSRWLLVAYWSVKDSETKQLWN